MQLSRRVQNVGGNTKRICMIRCDQDRKIADNNFSKKLDLMPRKLRFANSATPDSATTGKFRCQFSFTIIGNPTTKCENIPLLTYSSVNQCATGSAIKTTSKLLNMFGSFGMLRAFGIENCRAIYSKTISIPFHAKKQNCFP
mmetsp:Transcript_12242/g.25308  ORF Transcript_12242/g.25308 Transcript_12242/m.25308 type:complete len:142 (+) Transcript_12242:2-427(+)